MTEPWSFTVIQEEYPFPLEDSRGKKKHAFVTDVNSNYFAEEQTLTLTFGMLQLSLAGRVFFLSLQHFIVPALHLTLPTFKPKSIIHIDFFVAVTEA